MNDLTPELERALLTRWREPHRKYHGEPHLRAGLAALAELGGTHIERVAYWFHDAVHSNTSPQDEHASVDVAREMLADHLSEPDLDEVARLILVTIDHVPEAADAAGARISDADLAGLALDWSGYVANRDGIRAELPSESEEAWHSRRLRMVSKLLGAERLFHTKYGQETWEERARANLERELAQLRQ